MIHQELGLFLRDITDLGKIDLHSHSTASDSSTTPDEVMQLATTNQLNFIALTDHDTIDGITTIIDQYPTLEKFLQNSKKDYSWLLEQIKLDLLPDNPLLIPGVELSVIFENQEIHLLAYFSGQKIKNLNPFLEEQRTLRYQRNSRLIKRLHQLNIPIPEDELEPTSDQPVTGRVKTARWLLENEYVTSINQAFKEYLAEGKPAYVPRERVSLESALEIIAATEGFPVIAHPHQYGWCESKQLLAQKIEKLTSLSQIGIEVYHSDATLIQQKTLLNLAQELNLPYTAGSDFHGINKEKHELYSCHDNPDNFYGKK
ncbi:MAG: PHP domain-containing protein [Saccharofermentanales bacterium]